LYIRDFASHSNNRIIPIAKSHLSGNIKLSEPHFRHFYLTFYLQLSEMYFKNYKTQALPNYFLWSHFATSSLTILFLCVPTLYQLLVRAVLPFCLLIKLNSRTVVWKLAVERRKEKVQKGSWLLSYEIVCCRLEVVINLLSVLYISNKQQQNW